MSKLKRYREAAGLTQKALSGLSGVNIRQIQRVESGASTEANMTARNLLAIADVLKVDIHELLEMEQSGAGG